MDFGLILFLTSILLGNPSDNNSNESSETQDSTSNNNKTTQQISSAEDTSSEDTQTDSRKLLNKAPTISGTADKVVMQDEHYDFTPLAIDIDNDQLLYTISNKPDWAVFDSRTGTVTGKPNNANIGTTKDIIITVSDSYGASSSLQPFSIEVINVNDQPIISGNPSLYVSPEKTFNFKPKVKDIDLDIGLDKLIFSIKNKPKWASFNTNTGELTGKPSGTFTDSDGITITVTDSYGKSDSLKPFYLQASYLNISQASKANNQTSKVATQINNNLSNADIRRAQQFYGAPTYLNYHLMKGDQFFTGLYKEGEADSSEYKFFEYGVINNDYRDAKPPTDIFRKNFFIAKDNKEDPILFKIPDNDHMTFLNPIDDLFVSFCRKEKNPDLKAISCNTLPTNNSEDTYDTIFKVNTKNQAIYYFDGPYRKNEVHFLYCKKEFLSSNSNIANVKDA